MSKVPEYPKITNLKARREENAAKKSDGGIPKIKDDIAQIKNLQDVQKVLEKLVKVLS